MYDYAHPLSDQIEGVTHSLCTLEFEDHRPLYDWLLDSLSFSPRPDQVEFARLNLTYTVMSKRRLLQLVQDGRVAGWDDPRMPTLSGLRRRGYTPEAIREFCERIGVAKKENLIDVALLEHLVREDLNRRAPRVMGVLDPLRVVIENYPEDQTEQMEVVNNPEDPAAGTRQVPFSRVIYIERDDFREDPPKKFFRLAPGREVRLRNAYFVTCTGVVKDASGADHGAAVHIRSRHARGRRARWPQGEGHAPLGVGRARARRRGAALRPALLDREPCAGATRQRLAGLPEPRFAPRAHGCQGGAKPGGCVSGARATSSSASATSAWIPIQRPGAWSSTAR